MYNIDGYFDVNCHGTAVLLESVIASPNKGCRLILASSRAVYGEGLLKCAGCGLEFRPGPRADELLSRGRWEHPCPACASDSRPLPSMEALPPNPTSIYGITKLTQEQVLQSVGRAYGFPVIIARYFNVYGPEQSPINPYTGVLTIFARRLLSGQELDIYEDGNLMRDFVHVDDVTRANVLTAETNTQGVFNICSGEYHTVSEIGRMLAKAMGQNPDILRITGRYRAGDVRHAIGSWAHAAEVIGYRPQVNLAAGLKSVLQWLGRQELPTADELDDVARKELEARSLLRRCGPKRTRPSQ
jgi:dTDP-L-rhamnose 4-epimerase